MKLVAYLKTGVTASHAGGWRHPASALNDMFDPWRYEQLARTLEAAGFDGCLTRQWSAPTWPSTRWRRRWSPPRAARASAVQSIADQMQDVFEAGGCDGFIVWPTVSPTMFEEFGRLVVPELQRRDLVQTQYGPARYASGCEGSA